MSGHMIAALLLAWVGLGTVVALVVGAAIHAANKGGPSDDAPRPAPPAGGAR